VRDESALNMFRQMDLKGQTHADTQLKTIHQNTINTIRVYEETGGAVHKFSSKLYMLHYEPLPPYRRRVSLTLAY
jgi:actin related protein 2/3 complex subunit 1A/1B